MPDRIGEGKEEGLFEGTVGMGEYPVKLVLAVQVRYLHEDRQLGNEGFGGCEGELQTCLHELYPICFSRNRPPLRPSLYIGDDGKGIYSPIFGNDGAPFFNPRG